jgi:hypothetical protein
VSTAEAIPLKEGVAAEAVVILLPPARSRDE